MLSKVCIRDAWLSVSVARAEHSQTEADGRVSGKRWRHPKSTRRATAARVGRDHDARRGEGDRRVTEHGFARTQRRPDGRPDRARDPRTVLAAARRLGYRPNPLARGLRGSRTMLLGVIVREITDPFFAGAVDAVSTEASRRGYNVVLGTAHARPTRRSRCGPFSRHGTATRSCCSATCATSRG